MPSAKSLLVMFAVSVAAMVIAPKLPIIKNYL